MTDTATRWSELLQCKATPTSSLSLSLSHGHLCTGAVALGAALAARNPVACCTFVSPACTEALSTGVLQVEPTSLLG